MSRLKWNRGKPETRGFHDDKIDPGYVPLTKPNFRINWRRKKDLPYIAIRDIKIYCDYYHNGLSYIELARKYYMNKNSVQPRISKTKERIERWRNETETK